MKRKTMKAVMVLITVLTLCVAAYAFWVDVVASYQTNGRGVLAISTLDSNGADGGVTLYTQVSVNDENLNSCAFGQNEKEYPTSNTLKAYAGAYDGALDVHRSYTVEAFGKLTYRDKYGPQSIFETDSTSFTYDPPNSRSIPALTAEEDLRERFHQERSDYLFAYFGLAPDEYTFTRDYGVMMYIDTNDYTNMREVMQIPNGSTSPSFYINGASDTIYCVFQDAEAVNYLYQFAKAEDGNWHLTSRQASQDAGRYQDLFQSFSEYAANVNDLA